MRSWERVEAKGREREGNGEKYIVQSKQFKKININPSLQAKTLFQTEFLKRSCLEPDNNTKSPNTKSY